VGHASRAGTSEEEGSAQPSSLASFLETLGLGSVEVEEQTSTSHDSANVAEGGGGAVTLSTVHKAKGLEWRVVWVPCVEEGVYPHERGLREAGTLDEGAEAMREEQRLLYVALTRSRSVLILSYALRRSAFGSDASVQPSPFVRSLPVDSCEALVFLGQDEAKKELASLEDQSVSEAEAMAREQPAAARWQAAMQAALRDAAADRHPPQVRQFLEDESVPSAAADVANSLARERLPTSRVGAQPAVAMRGPASGHATIAKQVAKRAAAHVPDETMRLGGFASAREVFWARGSKVFHSEPASSGASSASGPTCQPRSTAWPAGGSSILNARSIGSTNIEPINAGFKKPRSIL